MTSDGARTIAEALQEWLNTINDVVEDRISQESLEARLQQLKNRTSDHLFGELSEHRNRRALPDEILALIREPRLGPAVLAGAGGAGKTTMAAHLADHAAELGNRVWWISAVDPVTLSRGLTAAAKQLGGAARDVEAISRGEADAPDRFWQLLESARPGWLLVFDEADDPRVLAADGSPAGVQDLTGWVRSSAHGLAMVTSRETDPRIWRAARLLIVDELGEAEAAGMLRELAPSAGDESQAKALARRLGRHPLSLRLAGSYLRSHAARGATFATYAQALGEKTEADLYARERHSAVSIQTLTARAVELSLDGLAQQGITQARPVLQLASCYGPTTIPASLLDTSSLAGLLTTPDDALPKAWGAVEEALRGLQDMTLFQPTTLGMAVHTSVTEAGRASLDGPSGADPSSARIRHAAIELLAARTAKLPVDQPEAWPEYLLLGTHLLSLLETTAERVDREHLGLLMETTARIADAFNQIRVGQAVIVLCERALTRGAALGNEHRAVLRIRHTQAWPIADKGDLDKAEALYRDVLRTRLRVFGAEDRDVLASRHELAWIAACRQDWARAEKGYRETLHDGLRILNPQDHQIMLTRHELAWAIANQGLDRLDEAGEIFRTVLMDRRQVLGAEHPRSLTTQHELAWITARKGEWKEAETAYRNLLDLRLRVLGEDHQDTLLTRHELAWIAARQGRIPEAESGYANVLHDRRRLLGEDHPHTLASQKALEQLRRGLIVDARHAA